MTTPTAGTTTRTRRRVNGSNTSTRRRGVRDRRRSRLGDTPDRCGYGPRLPLIVISPYTRENYVSHNVTDQSSVVKFIEDNWLHGESTGAGSFTRIAGSLDAPGGVLDFRTCPHFEPLILNPATGAVVSGGGWPGKKS